MQPSSTDTTVKCNSTRLAIPAIDVSTGEIARHCFTSKEPVKDSYAANVLQEMYHTEFNEVASEKRALSQEDEMFLKTMKSGATKRGQKHELPLPFRNENVFLPSNRQQVRNRMLSLKRGLAKNTGKHASYAETMQWIISNYAQKADCSKDIPGKVWHIPHHSVYNQVKEKLRVVFNASAIFGGSSLNNELIQGPDMVNPLVGVLARFRKEEVAIMADIEAMFYQVQVPESQRSFLRFFWWKDGDLDAELEEYEMCVHLFGAASSSGCANYALKKTADDAEPRFGADVAKTVRRDFYVDDWLKSVTNAEAAKALIKDVKDVCASGGFNLTKFISNSREVIDSVPAENRAPSVVNLDLSSALPIERQLGLTWCIEDDTLSFRVVMKDNPLTKRSVLGTISSIYDPHGLVSPFVLPGRKILQKITREGGCWDDDLSTEHRASWEKWRANLPALQNIKVRRCLKPPNFNVASASLHCFSDASEYGYGQASYLRQVSVEGEVCVSLVMGKARVVPKNAPTIPRLELTASLASAKVSALLVEELDIDNLTVRFWVDSMIVLGYIQNDVKRFRTYVANRSKKIRNMTKKECWRHVLTDENPADDASRGLAVSDTEKVDRWFNGPSFLKQLDGVTLKGIVCADVPDDDPEVIVEVKSNAVQVEEGKHHVINSLGVQVSSWMRMKRVVATMMLFTKVGRRQKPKGTQFLVEDMVAAEILLLKMIQAKHFGSEVSALSEKRSVVQTSGVCSLDPFLDTNGIMRVGGRLRNTDLEESVKHPIILPKKEVVVRRLIEWCHEEVQHLGRTTTLGEVRSQGYWLVSAHEQIRQVVYNCVRCRALRGLPVQQKMSDLPKSRTDEESPFTYCGVDLFGPFTIKERRSELKRWGVIFTCFSCRAIHLETTNTMDTDSFILALRRFVGRRGPVCSIRSDNGGNFVGADNEMQKEIKEMDHCKIKDFLLSENCDWEWVEWERNPASASHMGGVWERQIRSVRNVLSSLLTEHTGRLNDESLRTLLVEVEAIVNSRPLCTDSLSDESSDPLSPNTLLTQKTKVVLPPPGTFQRADVYCRKRWRTVQYLANEFWSRWRKEFLMGLQKRQKWNTVRPNLQVGDVVLVSDPDVKRNQWPMGRISEVFPGEDGLVRKVNVKVSGSDNPWSRSVAKIVLLMKCPSEN